MLSSPSTDVSGRQICPKCDICTIWLTNILTESLKTCNFICSDVLSLFPKTDIFVASWYKLQVNLVKEDEIYVLNVVASDFHLVKMHFYCNKVFWICLKIQQFKFPKDNLFLKHNIYKGLHFKKIAGNKCVFDYIRTSLDKSMVGVANVIVVGIPGENKILHRRLQTASFLWARSDWSVFMTKNHQDKWTILDKCQVKRGSKTFVCLEEPKNEFTWLRRPLKYWT